MALYDRPPFADNKRFFSQMSEDENNKPQRAVQSVEVGGRLLLALAGCPEPMSLKELAAQAGLPPSRAHPYLVSFGRLGLIRQDGASGRYALGPAALQLGLTALHQLEPMRAIGPIAEKLAADTGQAVAVAVWGNLGPTVVRMIDAQHPLHVAMRAGTVMSPFATATGRAFIAVMSSAAILDALNGAALGFEGPAGKLRPGDFAPKVEEARRELAAHGCIRTIGKPIPGVNAFSAPVFDFEGRPALVLTLLGHQDHVPAAWNSRAAGALKQAAGIASRELGSST